MYLFRVKLITLGQAMQNPLEIRLSKLNTLSPEKGHILVSDPYLPDPSFRRSVVLLCEHNENGTFGLILNKPLGLAVNDTLIGFPDFAAEVFMGGPVEPDKLFFIHTLGNTLNASVHISGNIYWSGDFEHLKHLAEKGIAHAGNVRFFIGYAGWEKGQLDKELKEDSWIVAQADEHDLMQDNQHQLWQRILVKMGGPYAILANFPEDPNMN